MAKDFNKTEKMENNTRRGGILNPYRAD